MSDHNTRPIDRSHMQISDEVAIDIRNMNKWYGRSMCCATSI
jgi:general L-amino acid transport system ATP-binding protein